MTSRPKQNTRNNSSASGRYTLNKWNYITWCLLLGNVFNISLLSPQSRGHIPLEHYLQYCILHVHRSEFCPIFQQKTEANHIIKRMQYFTICGKENLWDRIIESICYCFFTNLGIQFLVHKLNYLIKNTSLIQYKDFVPIHPYLIN